jgi:type II secretory pathway pseudopilin PulG
MFMLALLVIAMAVAVPRVREEIQRDRELETMQRGKQYIRGIKMYYKKFNSYPPNVDALVKTNEIRFLRKRYLDPMTGKDDWKPILFGQNKAPVALGFFGQPLVGGSTLAGTGPGGIAGASPMGGTGAAGGSTFGNGSNGSNGSSFGSGSSFGASSSFGSGSSFGGSSSFGSGSSFSNSGSAASGGSAFGSSGTGSTTGTGTATGSTTGGSSTGGTGDSSGSSSFGSNNGGSLSSTQTFGGGGIIGFSPASPKQSILTYKTKTHYNEWEFVYSPLVDQMRQGGNAGTIGQPAGGLNNGFGGTGTGTSNGIGSGFSNTPGGSSPTAPTAPATPTTPQQ